MKLIMPENNLEDLYRLALRIKIDYPNIGTMVFRHRMTEQFDGLDSAIKFLNDDTSTSAKWIRKILDWLGYSYHYDSQTEILSVYYKE